MMIFKEFKNFISIYVPSASFYDAAQ